MKTITVTNQNTQKRTNLFEMIIDGRRFWFLPSEIRLAESRPGYYTHMEEQERNDAIKKQHTRQIAYASRFFAQGD